MTNTSPAASEEQADWGFGGPPAPPPPGGGPVGDPGTPAGLGDPTLGVDVIVEPVSGYVLVGAPGSFEKLTSPRRIPVGSLVDARKGKVRVISATGRAAKRQSGTFSGGLFRVTQSKKRSAKGLTNLTLKGSASAAAPARVPVARARARSGGCGRVPRAASGSAPGTARRRCTRPSGGPRTVATGPLQRSAVDAWRCGTSGAGAASSSGPGSPTWPDCPAEPVENPRRRSTSW